MSLAREMSRGFFLKARLGVNGSQNALKSFGTSARGAGLTAAAVFIGSAPSGQSSLPRTMAAAPLFVQFSVINRLTLGQASAAPALAPRERGARRFSKALASESLGRPA